MSPRVIPSFGTRSRLRIGLLGGSFNPAHAGHRYIAEEALKRLGLDQVWLMVSPQNPLKPTQGMAPLAQRAASCHKIIKQHPQIRVTTVETRLGTRYTADTVSTLCKRYPAMDFVWIMGADNLMTFHRWQQSDTIFRRCRIAIFHRPSYSIRALSSPTAHRYKHRRKKDPCGAGLFKSSRPVWTFIRLRGMALSASAIRAQTLS